MLHSRPNPQHSEACGSGAKHLPGAAGSFGAGRNAAVFLNKLWCRLHTEHQFPGSLGKKKKKAAPKHFLCRHLSSTGPWGAHNKAGQREGYTACSAAVKPAPPDRHSLHISYAKGVHQVRCSPGEQPPAFSVAPPQQIHRLAPLQGSAKPVPRPYQECRCWCR